MAAILLGLVLVAWYFYPVAKVQYHEQRQKDLLERELAALKERNALLRSQVDRLRTPEGVEDLARTKMGYVRKGEHAYVVTDRASGEQTGAAVAEPPPAPQPLVYRLLDAVFGTGG